MGKKNLGVSADGFWLQMASVSNDPLGDVNGQPGKRPADYIPHAILLPRFENEPFRMDIGIEPHPRGSGRSWPVEAIAHQQYGVGRLPLASLLERIERGDAVEWHTDSTRSYSCSQALADSLAGSVNTRQNDVDLVFVIPNHWNELLQQKLLDAFQFANLNCRLLWRPVAAALDWCDNFSAYLGGYQGEQGDTVGKLLSLYIGFDTIEVTELDLVRWGNGSNGVTIVPARKRPKPTDRMPSFGFRQAIQNLAQTPEEVRFRVSGSNDLLSYVWNQLWCTNLVASYERKTVFNDLSSAASDSALEAFTCNIEQLNPIQIKLRLQQCKKLLESKYDGIVISGALANCDFITGKKIWKWCTECLDVTTGSFWIEGYNCESGLLTRGACCFGRRLQDERPTYLDTLPRLEMVISDKGEPAFIDLLDPEQKWVDGGRIWHRPERITNLSIATGSIDLKLAVSHEEFVGVREVVTDLPCKAEATEKVSLSVQMFPAQGNARIELHPDHPGFFDKQRVFVDWKKMHELKDESGNTLSKEDYLDSLPRSFPGLLPRIMSRSKWRNASTFIQRIRASIQRNAPVTFVNNEFRLARESFREKDSARYPQDATAFDSNGKCFGEFDLDEFMNFVWPYFLKYQPSEFVRAMAYTHVNHKEFHEYVLRNLSSGYTNENFVVAAGKCFRNPDHIVVFVDAFLSDHRKGASGNAWWKALSEILRFRSNATQNISSEKCLTLMNIAGKQFEMQRRAGGGGEYFRLVCLVIVYLLRRRAFDDTFLDPDGDTAIWIKNQFRQARADVKAGKLTLMGGSIDLSQQLQLIIDYVDRKGRGQLLIGG
ncbi:MAG: hypothetical protein JNK90_22920 [Planctomycetaceae bacterium]|nr:hypothetical protein [Planctomycetaceae bacterium]